MIGGFALWPFLNNYLHNCMFDPSLKKELGS